MEVIGRLTKIILLIKKKKKLELSSGNLSNNLGIKETIFMPV